MLRTIGLPRAARVRASIVLTSILTSIIFAMALGMAAPSAQAQANNSTPATRTDRDTDAEPRRNFEEVVVTARKVEESVQNVPISVVALSAQQLEQRSIEDLGDLGAVTPNLTFAEQPQSGRTGGVIFIRGVGQREPISAYDPAVGLYIDGVYMGRMYANNLDMLELDRVEVLRGPQGTLFGKNTSGGAISITTKQPDTSADAFAGRVQVTSGSRDRLDVLGSFNIPLVADRLALRLAGSKLSQDGYGERADGQDMGDTNREIARAQLLLRATDNFSALLSGDWTHFDEKNAPFKLVDTNPGISPLVALNTLTTERYDDRWLSPRDYFDYGTGPNSSRGTLRGASLTLAYETGGTTFKSISAYGKLDVHNDLDPDGSPVEILNKFEPVTQDQFSQELQVAGTAFADRLHWIAGAFYFRERIDQWESYDLLTPLFGNTRDYTRHSPIENDSIAVFGQGIYNLTDQLRLTAGLRYTQDEKRIQFTQYTFTGAVQFSTPMREHASDSVSPRLGLDYQWTPDVMTYVSVAQGAKNGGFNGRVGRPGDFNEFDDEVVWTYEVGLRSDLFDGLARFNATAFYSKYSDLQLQISGSTVVNGVPAAFGVITNIPEANIKGGEVEIMVMPLYGLTLSGALGLTYGEYTRLPTDDQFIASRAIDKDSKFSHTPEVSYDVGAEYTTALGDNFSLTARTDYAYKSKIYYNAENTVNLIQPGYGLLNARLTFEHRHSGVAISVFGTNLTDKVYMVGGFDDAASPNPGLGFSIISQGAPRTVGVSAQMRF